MDGVFGPQTFEVGPEGVVAKQGRLGRIEALKRLGVNGGADVLRITPVGGAPVLHPSPLATWGLHLVDVNIVLGNLVADVAAESAAYHPSH